MTASVWRQLVRAVVLPLAFVTGGAVVLAPMLSLGVTDQAADRSYTSVLEPAARPLLNLGVTALFRAGFIRMEVPEEEEPQAEGEVQEEAEVEWATNALPQSGCAPDPVVAALVAAEVYMRPAPRRKLEEWVAEARRGLFGRYPDWSYGMGQVRLSTAVEAIAAAETRLGRFVEPSGSFDQDEVYGLLTDVCSNVQLVAMVVEMIRQPGDTTAQIAARYRGGVARPTIPGVVGHEALVTTMAERILPLVRQGPISMQGFAGEGGGPLATGRLGLIPLDASPAADIAPVACLGFEGEVTAQLYSASLADREGFEGEFHVITPDVEALLAGLGPEVSTLLVVDLSDPEMFEGLSRFWRFADQSAAYGRVPGLTSLPWRDVQRLADLPAGLDAEALSCFGTLILARSPQARLYLEQVKAAAR